MDGAIVHAGGSVIPFPNEDPSRIRVLVRENAARLIERTRERFPEWSPPPFDPERYAACLGIPIVSTESAGDWDALFVPVGPSPRIVLNARVASFRRQAFSIAHEIAHTWFDDSSGTRHFLRARDRERYYQDASMRELERCCDLAAAELLMPQPWFGEALARRGLRAAAVPDLAEQFAVSFEATALRMVETAGETCAVGFFEFGMRGSGRQPRGAVQRSGEDRCAYRVRRVLKSDGFPFLFPPGKSVPDASVIYRCSLQRGEMCGTERFALRGASTDLEVTAFPLHRSEAVTLPPTVCAVFRPAGAVPG